MHLADAHALAISLLSEYGLRDWTFAFNRRKRAFGLCDYTKRTVLLSSVLTEFNGEAEVRDTLLHEIAHALAVPKAGHGPVWRELALKVGTPPKRCYGADEVQQPPGRYLLVCPSCQESTPRHRNPARSTPVAAAATATARAGSPSATGCGCTGANNGPTSPLAQI